MSIEEYRKEKMLLLTRVRIREESRITMARFQSDLRYVINDRLALLPYNGLNDLVELCIKVEQKLQRISRDYPSTSYSRRDSKKEGGSSKSTYERPQEKDRREKSRNKKKETNKNIIIKNPQRGLKE